MTVDTRSQIDPALVASRRYTWNTQLRRHAFQMPDRTAIRFRGQTTTWAQLHDRVERLASALHRRGVGEGARVALVMTNRSEYVESVLALNRLGAIAVPVNFRLVADEVAWILADCGATGLLVDAPLAGVAGKIRADHPELLCIVVGGAGSVSDAGPDAEDYDEVLAAATPDAPPVVVEENATCLIMYTSGTTGRPKGAMLSHLNLLMQSVTIVRGWQLFSDDEITLVSAPLFHIAGIGAIAPMLLIGGVTVIQPTAAFDPIATVDLLAAERVTGVFLVPTQWQAICDALGSGDNDRNRGDLALRAMSWGASPAPASTLQAMADTFPGLPNIAVFGQTEMSPVTCVLDGADALRKIGSVGKPVPTVAVRIVDEEMNDVPDGEVGEIVYRGPSLMEGYWGNPQATAEAFADGWFHSGDLVRRDDEGFIYVVDRKKDMIISGGENIYCAEVESVLAGHPKVLEVSLIGAPHPRWVETPMAVVTPRDPADPPTLEELNDWSRDRLASYKKPTRIEIVEALPRNASGKVLKGDLRERYTTA